MPEATITFEDGRTLRLAVNEWRFESDETLRHTDDGRPIRGLSRAITEVTLRGVVTASDIDLTNAVAISDRNERSRAALLQPPATPPEAEPRPRPPAKPKPKSAWDRLLADDTVEAS